MNLGDITVDICICTYRRAHLTETIRSLSKIYLRPGWKIRVIVADNDETPSARMMAEAAARECSLTLTYLHAPARNISIARNACLDAARAPLLAFIDDDETATPVWLDALVKTLENEKADIVLGPVRAVYGRDAPEWMKKGDFFSSKPVWVNNEIRTGYAGNVMLRRSAPGLQGLRFRRELGRTGGEDSMFLYAAYKGGARIAYAQEAIVNEPVPAERARMQWLLKRKFRSGQTHGLFLLENSDSGLSIRLKNVGMASAKAMFCFAAALPNAARAERFRFWLLRGAMHAGVVARLLGKREIEQYG